MVVRPGSFAISLIVVALLLSVGMVGQQAKTALADQSAWFSPNDPGLEEFPDRVPLPRSDYNTDCVPETGVVRPAGIIPPLNPFSEETIQGCAIRSAGGRFMQSLFKLDGTHQYGSLSETARPIPGSTSVLHLYGGTSQVSNAYLIPNFANLLQPTKLSDGKLRYNLRPYSPIYLKDIRGSPFDIDHSSISFSSSGEWLIASTFQGILRYNLATHEQLLFDTSLNYQSGIAPLVQSAITNDGHYAVIATGPYSRFRVYNLQDCPTINSPSLGRKNCKYREMYGLFPPKTGDHVQFQEVRFLSDYALKFYRREQFGSTSKTSQYLLLAPGTTAPHFEYLALGDSYTAGEGAYQYRSGTDTNTNRCRTSEISYPYLIKHDLQLIQAESVACAGATTWDISNSDPTYTGQVKDGLRISQRNIQSILSGFLPGYLPQVSFVEHYLPDIVTVSISGNDIGFGDKLRACLSPGTCFKAYEDRLEVLNEINHAHDKLLGTYSSVKARNRPTARIYTIGYPEVAKTGGDCGLNVLLNNDEIVFSNLLIGKLNSTIKGAATEAGINYIDVTNAFGGHRLCETAYSNTAVNGLTAGGDAPDWGFFKGPIAGESFHPNALGHRLYKQAIMKGIQSNKHPPPPEPATPEPLLSAPKTNRTTNHLTYNPKMSADNFLAGSTQPVQIGPSLALKPESSFTISLADQALIASSDEEGKLNSSIEIPVGAKPGFASLAVTGQNTVSEDVQFYKTVYIASALDDFDGDGLSNDLDNCPLIDFSCDGPVATKGEDNSDIPGHDQPSSLNREVSISPGVRRGQASHKVLPKNSQQLPDAPGTKPANPKLKHFKLLLALSVLVFSIGLYVVISES